MSQSHGLEGLADEQIGDITGCLVANLTYVIGLTSLFCCTQGI